MTGSVLLYLGVTLALLGLVSLAVPRWRRARRTRIVALCAILGGTGLGVIGVRLPSRDVVIARPRERLDAMMPRYQFHERHAVWVDASPPEVDHAIRSVTAEEIPFYRTLTWIRRLGRRGREGLLDAPRGAPLLALATQSGFQLLFDEPGREIVVGVAGPVSQVARAREAARSTRTFVAAADGYASIAMNVRVSPDGRGGSLLSTETRVFAPDAETRRRLATYWRVIHPGSALIRRGWLAAIRRRAERGAP